MTTVRSHDYSGGHMTTVEDHMTTVEDHMTTVEDHMTTVGIT